MGSQWKFENLDVTQRKGLLIITINRPNKKNAFSRKMYEGVTQILNDAAHNDEVSIVAFTGAGDYYSSGNDLSGYSDYEGASTGFNAKTTDTVKNMVTAFIDFPKILVAVVNGPAIGIAVTKLGLCDIVFASEKATFRTPFTILGLCAEGCSTYTFPRIMGTSKAGSMLYFNYQMDAKEAYTCGLVSHLFKTNDLPNVLQKLEEASTLPVKSLMANKKLMRKWDQDALHRANELESQQLEERIASEDCVNAIIKFMQSRNKL
ncbi:enoyl-CoA delta isomerase 2-like isoform X1 [Schistocerca gregaria]|uniref:enoyl-CoA delta isomerase 2-like isoform X1 n=1 Tax=Schistocerca gregaria TaxID=7010 RepID=UPI00211EE402|nr:enoyl-CoA delta isomerase 2-like isoform X1 [Schistocerca gregaria]XP_049862518.1 enoyl-CoA delta isomerase 2-like isoform X1 [Schistocerca gregaria]XP_049862519.1 enoyl-CoA delta isomerase 2-like isoform X1 [Schistocerca gregaria]